MEIRTRDGSRAREILGRTEVREEYFCNYELNPAYRERFDKAGLAVTGEGEGGEARIVEIPSHPFFLGALFQPQRSSHHGRPHPLIRAFVEAAARPSLTRVKP